MKTQTPTLGRGCGSNGIGSRSGKTIIPLVAPSPNRSGILSFRTQRNPGEIIIATTNVLIKEARLARQTGVNTSPEVLEDISAWIARGCLPA